MSNELVPFKSTRTSLALPKDLTFAEWKSVGREIEKAAEGCMWWLGDWWAFGDAAYGERAAAVLEDNFGWAFQTCINAGNVARKFKTNRRRLVLPYKHHAEVAALPEPEQERLLDQAEENGWSAAELRSKVKQLKQVANRKAQELAAAQLAAEKAAKRKAELAEKAAAEKAAASSPEAKAAAEKRAAAEAKARAERIKRAKAEQEAARKAAAAAEKAAAEERALAKAAAAEAEAAAKEAAQAAAAARAAEREVAAAAGEDEDDEIFDADVVFDLIYADPPWRYDFAADTGRAIENQYPTMDVDEICELDVPAADDCILFLWATSPKLIEAIDVLQAWGFEYITCAVWDKGKIGMGYYFRQQHELLLVGKKGDMPAPGPQSRVSSVIRVDSGKHSAKPHEVYDIIERMYPELDKVELFARNTREGWYSWGNQV